MSLVRRLPSCAGLLLFAVLTHPAKALQATRGPELWVIRNVALGRNAEDTARGTLVLRDGRIESILAVDAEIPHGARIVEGDDLIALPAFLDAYSRNGLETPEPRVDQDRPADERADVRIDMREANRKGIAPSFRAVDVLAVAERASEPWREAGFGAALVAPSGQLLSGKSVLVTTREAALRNVVARPEVFLHAAFDASGPGYPSTLMGYVAQLRQFFLDAQHQGELEQRYEDGRPGQRPAWDVELDAGRALMSGEVTLACEAASSRDIERWLKLADQFGLQVGFTGGREAWRVADTLAERDVPVVLTLDWGDEVDDPYREDDEKRTDSADEEPEGESGETDATVQDTEETEDVSPEEPAEPEERAEDAAPEVAAADAPEREDEAAAEDPAKEERTWEYLEPIEVRAERRRLWEETRDCALRLAEAGVRFSFGSGSDKPKDVLKNVRTLVEAGLPADAAEAALTTNAAELLGAGRRLGRIAPGYDASLALWTSDPLTDRKAKVAWIFVDGYPTEYDLDAKERPKGPPAEGLDVTGTWTVELDSGDQGPRDASLELEMDDDGEITGTLRMDNPRGDDPIEAPVEGHLAGHELTLEATLSFGRFDVQTSLTATVKRDSMEGKWTQRRPSGGDRTRDWSATRTPDREAGSARENESCHEEEVSR